MLFRCRASLLCCRRVIGHVGSLHPFCVGGAATYKGGLPTEEYTQTVDMDADGSVPYRDTRAAGQILGQVTVGSNEVTSQ